VYARAALLDWVIDPVADWIEAADWLDEPAAYRAENAAVHGRAAERYRQLYPPAR
jgi:hypothetical protein